METITVNHTIRDIAVKTCSLLAATIEITKTCNFRCEHCYLENHTITMETQTIIRVLNELKEAGVLNLVLTGGEIFTHKDILTILKYARTLGMRVTLLTNFSLLNEHILDTLREYYITDLSTTVFSLDAAINDSITGVPGSLRMVLDKMELAKKYGMKVEVKTPIMQKNKDGVALIQKYCEKNGYSFDYTPEIVSKEDGDSSPVKLSVAVPELSKVLKELNYKDRVEPRKGFNPEDYICLPIRYSICILCDGSVYPCISFPISYGNIYENSISEIWKNSKNRQEILKVRKGDLTECVHCTHSEYCLRCPGIAYGETGNYLGCAPQAKTTAVAYQCANNPGCGASRPLK